jgi:two-component system, cell cycle sensor histidine kinase and response regulator CckA
MTALAESERAQLEQTLANSEAYRQLLLDSSLDCIICTDAEARITEFNAAAVRVFRIARAEALGRDLPGLLLPQNVRSQYRSHFLPAESSAGIELIGNRVETSALRADGKEFPAEFTVTRVLIDSIPSFVLHVRDITARKRAEEAVVWLAAVVESSQDAIIGKNLDGVIISWNRGAESMYGYTAAEIIGQPISGLVPSNRAAEIPRIMERLRRGQRIKSYETDRVTKDGRLLNVSLTISPVKNSEGKITGASVIARDITAEKLAKEALRKATETSIYSSPVPIVAADVSRRVTAWNRAAEAVFGWSELEIIGEAIPFIPPDELERANKLHERLLAGETLTDVEVRRKRKDGSTITVSLSASPVWDEHRRVKGIIGFLCDISDRKNTEEALRRAEEKYRSIFENAVEGIYQATPEGTYLSANPALARMLGFDHPQELIAARSDISKQEYIDPNLRSTFIQSVEAKGVLKNFEYEAYRRDGKRIWLSASAHAVRDANGRCLYLEGTVQDITERRDLEQLVRQMQKMEAVGRLAGGVAHDFNNILMAISSYAELLDKKTAGEAPRRYVAEISKAVSRGSSLTLGLLTFSRKQVSSPKVLDLNNLVPQQLDMLKRLIPENIALKFIAGVDVGNVHADSGQIEQVVMNLVINARDAMPAGGTVVIETQHARLNSGDAGPDSERLQDFVLLSVADTGCGMDAETKSHLFEPFYTTKDQGKGTGLGLATVFGVVKQSAGQIFVESEPGKGTIFRIYLPRVDERADTSYAEEAIEVEARGETILLVEDEKAVRESAAEYLSVNGYKVLKAAHGQEALEIVHGYKGPIDLLLTDLVMPQMSGVELSQKIAAAHPETKIVFMSGYSRNLLSNPQHLQSHCVLLQKPFQLKALGQCIRRTLREKTEPGDLSRSHEAGR